MKYIFGLAALFASSLVFSQNQSLGGTEDAYVKALEFVYEKQYQEAIPRLEAIYASSSSAQVAETLGEVYYSQIEELAAQGRRREIDSLYPSMRSNIEAMFAKHPTQSLFQSGVKIAFLLNDGEFASSIAEDYLKVVPNDPAAESIAALTARRSNDPDTIIQAYGPIARSVPSSPEDISLIAQARWELARAYQMKNQGRTSLSYLRLMDKVQKIEDLRLASLEFSFFNFPYAIAQMERFGTLTPDQQILYIGALFAEGSAQSLKKMDALLSAKKDLSPYEEALSLHRRGINPRALLTLEQETAPMVHQLYPHLYLNLRYKILSRLRDSENLVPVLESLGGQSYLAGKRELALSYLTNLKENEKGELSYLLGTIYAKEKDFDRAKAQFLAHLKLPDAQYKAQVLSELTDLAFQQGDYAAAEDYINRYENLNGENTQEAAVPRGQLALKRGNFASAEKIFSDYFTQLFGENARTVAGYHIASIYLGEWMQSDQNKDILIPQATKYIDAAHEIVKNQEEGSYTFFDINVLNLYAYCHAMSDEKISPEILAAAEYAASRLPTAEVLDTAAVVFFRANEITGGTKSAEYYFSELEKELALMDDEVEYSKTLAPPYFDKTSEKKSQYYEIYTHLAAWYRYLGKEQQAQKAENEALRLADDKELARRQMDWLTRVIKK